MAEIELQRCPNCGGPAKLHTKRGKFYYECDGDCWTSTGLYSTQEGAAREWNRLEKRKSDQNCLFCKHSMSGGAMCGRWGVAGMIVAAVLSTFALFKAVLKWG